MSNRYASKRRLLGLLAVIIFSVILAACDPDISDLKDKGDIDQLIEALYYKETSVRYEAYEALSTLVDKINPEQTASIIGLLDEDQEESTRNYSAQLLGQIGDSRAIEPLITSLDDGSETVRISAAISLVQLGDEQEIDRIIDILFSDASWQGARKNSSEVYQKLSVQAVEPLLEVLGNEDNNVRWEAVSALGVIADPRAIESLISLLDDETSNSSLKKAVLSALGKFDDIRATEALIAVLVDKNSNLTDDASWGLINMGEPAVIPLLEVLRASYDSILNSRITGILGSISAPDISTIIASFGYDVSNLPEAWIEEMRANYSAIGDELAPVVDGRGVPGAAAYDPENTASLKIFVLDESGAVNAWIEEFSPGFSPASLGETSLVAIIGENREIDMGKSDVYYSDGTNPSLSRYEMDVQVRSAQTGELITAGVINGTAPVLSSSKAKGASRIYGKQVTSADLEQWLTLNLSKIVMTGHTAEVTSLAFTPDGQILASGSVDNTLQLWQTSDGTLLDTLEGHASAVYGLAFSPDGQSLASESSEGVRLWDTTDGSHLRSLAGGGRDSGLSCITFSPDGQFLAQAADDSMVKLWRVSDGRLAYSLEGHSNVITSLIFMSDGQTLASGSLDDSVRFWDIETGEMVDTITAAEGEIWGLVLSPDGSMGVYWGRYGDVLHAVGAADGEPIYTIRSDIDASDYFSVGRLYFSPDGEFMASHSFDSRVHLWKAQDGTLLDVLKHYSQSSAISIAFSTDGKMAIGMQDGSIVLLPVREIYD